MPTLLYDPASKNTQKLKKNNIIILLSKDINQVFIIHGVNVKSKQKDIQALFLKNSLKKKTHSHF